MSKLSTALILLKTNRNGLLISVMENLYFLFPDKLYLQLLYRLKLGRKPDLKDPQRFTEKLQWLKLYNRKPEYTVMVDKYAVKGYVARIIGDEHIIPTLGVWDRPEDIDFDGLPDQFVLKTTHGGGGTGVVICKDKSIFNRKEAIRELKRSMKANIYGKLREWPYKNVQKRVIAEKYMGDGDGQLRDYKFFCFNGEPRAMLVASNRYTTHNFDYFDMDFNHLPIVSVAGEPLGDKLEKPVSFDEMKIMAAALSKGLPHVRVDLYSTKENIYFGELTFFDSSGFDNMTSDMWDLKFGSWLEINT